MFRDAYTQKSVLVTGHTGFKGSWLCEWLILIGARVTGLSLPPPSSPALFDLLDLRHRLDHIEGDVRDPDLLGRIVAGEKPDFIFHLAAQPLVRRSYREPAETFEINVQGTVNLLDAVRRSAHRCNVVVITSDKCYENRETDCSYRETDPLGGYDPYSASKAAAELVVGAYRRSFFGPDSLVRLASARAGNVIGGGDWAEDRFVPDCIRALSAGRPIPVRNPRSTRPWQHVLEPLAGYLWLGACLDDPARADSGKASFAEAFNFGPGLSANKSVSELLTEVLKHWPGQWVDAGERQAFHEAVLLNLAIDKAWHQLRWRPLWSFETCVRNTVTWYRQVNDSPDLAQSSCREQLQSYLNDARAAGLAWSL
ncbi:MAG: CDP-glucose 4,6-dehydratase [Opitutaceae bacterium]|jgi:CDP-glucose 4,6-dehydratase